MTPAFELVHALEMKHADIRRIVRWLATHGEPSPIPIKWQHELWMRPRFPILTIDPTLYTTPSIA